MNSLLLLRLAFTLGFALAFDKNPHTRTEKHQRAAKHCAPSLLPFPLPLPLTQLPPAGPDSYTCQTPPIIQFATHARLGLEGKQLSLLQRRNGIGIHLAMPLALGRLDKGGLPLFLRKSGMLSFTTIIRPPTYIYIYIMSTSD